MSKLKLKQQVKRGLLLYLPLMVFLAFVAVPILWTLSLSLKDERQIVGETFRLLPSPLTVANYIYVWTKNKMSLYFINSLQIGGVSVIAIVIFSLLNGYALSRFHFLGKNLFVIALLMTQMIPLMLNIVPIFIMVNKMGISDTKLSLILLNVAENIAFNTLLMRGFISSIPREIDEAAAIDGCSRLQVIYKVIIPVIIPGLVTVAAFAFISCWNEYLLSYTLISTNNKFPISVGLKYLIGEYSVNYCALAAGSVIALIPPVLLFGIVQRYLIEGISAGAVKG